MEILSTEEMIFRFLLLVSLLGNVVKTQFNLHDTYRITDGVPLQFDCLQHYLREKMFSLSNFDYIITRHTSYCLRSTELINLSTNETFKHVGQNFTFNGLRDLNVTAEQLLLWLASVDLAEQYQDYLNHPTIFSVPNDLFFNCTRPWFGSRCQYSFLVEGMLTLNGILQATFNAKSQYANPHTVTNLTCYVHLKCDRGGPPMCLDWREVCNGRVDCLDGGLDELHCFELEINECGENEFRCSNGLCVGEEYWQSGDQNYVCPSHPVPAVYDKLLDYCIFHPSSKCDERLCSSEKPFSCGDGQCVEDFDACRNGRHHLLMQSMSAQRNLSHECWVTMICLTNISGGTDRIVCEHFFNSSDRVAYIQSCDSPTQFPTIPVLLGHVRFLYDVKSDRDLDDQLFLPPDYVCYDELLCDFLTPTFRNGSNTCRYGHEMGLERKVKYGDWLSIIHSIKPYFRGCSMRHENESYLQHPSLYRCHNSSKRISKHRIVDGIWDCYMNDDEEQVQLSCSMNDTHRFKCHNEDKCRSPLFSQDSCPTSNQYRLENILFQEACDGENHTNETKCDHWPCNSIYTRCNSFRACPNGEDERNCIASTCNPPSLLCVDPHNYTLNYLSVDRVGDGTVDCLGAIDEAEFCRDTDLNFSYYRQFRCWNATTCVSIFSLCDGRRDCPFGDDEDFCDVCRDICLISQLSYQKSVEEAHCQFGQLQKMNFSLESSPTYSASKYKSIDHTEKRSVERNNIPNDAESERVDPAWSWRCNRGIYARVSLVGSDGYYKCFCPSSYYGDRCQYQNQRVLVQLGVSLSDGSGIYTLVVILIDDDERQEVHSYEQFNTVARQYCGESFDFDLLYATRPKNDSKKYSVRVDAFDKTSLAYVASWHFSIRFLFLPVNQLTVVLNIPSVPAVSRSNCVLKCDNGECLTYTNEKKFFCRCRPGWSGAHCQIPVNCKDCSSKSICVGQMNNRSICVCPMSQFGPRCLLTLTCPPNFCNNNGRCIVINPSYSNAGYACICSEQFGGLRCEQTKARLDIHFSNMQPPSHLFIHIITVNEYQPPVQKVMFQKLLALQQIVTLYNLEGFQIVYVKVDNSYYMVVLQQFQQPHLSTQIDPVQRCRPINELLNSTITAWPRIRQVKYYHMSCQTHSDLRCFFGQSYMCLCTSERHANCFEFDHAPDLTCRDKTRCLNGGQCFQEHQLCPVDILCICTDCYFGDRCQFYARGIGLTLDDILRYEIRTNATLADQPFSVKASAALTMIMFATGIVNSVLSLMTFQSPDSQKVGCGVYLSASSITSLLTVTIFTIKFWFLILTQMNASVSRSVLRGGCIFIESILKLMLYWDNWLGACVAVERAVTVLKGVNFNKFKSRQIARGIVPFLPLLIMSTIIHEPLHRDLFDDKEENRAWCVTAYPPSVQKYNTAILFFHFVAPFSCNLFSALFIIINAARHRAKTRTRQSYKQHLREQFNEHKQLVISPMLLIALSLPRLIISLLSGCVKSSRNPWLYLSGYFISFIPSIVLFVAFVLPSNLYRTQFKESLKNWRRRIS